MATVTGWGVDQIYASKAGTANNKTTLCQIIKMPMIWLAALPPWQLWQWFFTMQFPIVTIWFALKEIPFILEHFTAVPAYPSKSIQRCEAVTPSSHPHPNTTTRIQPVVVRNDPKGCWHPASRKPCQASSCAKLIDVIPGTWFMITIRPGPIQVERTWRKIDWEYGTTGGYATLSFTTSNLLKKHIVKTRMYTGWMKMRYSWRLKGVKINEQNA